MSIYQMCVCLSDVEEIDQFGNKTDSLSAESVKGLTVSADDLDEAALLIDWQVNITKDG